MTVPVMSLGPKGVITDPNEKLRVLFTHGYLADKSQSTLHGDVVFSFQYIAALYGNDPTEHASNLQTELTNYLYRYFPDGVEVVVKEKDPGVLSRYTLLITASVTENGHTYSIGESLFVDNPSVIKRLNDALD